MCGIAGFIGSQRLSEERIGDALKAMSRRGPDSQASAHFTRSDGRHLHLLHSRLTIVDLDHRSDQPFERGPVTLAFNGEIYNFVELRQELEKIGEAFKTTSDTEVLAAALNVWSPLRSFDECEGMWALAAFDRRSESVIISRDRFGEKPLFLLAAPEGIYFGSEVKFLHALLGRRLRPNVEHLRRYLVNGYKALYKARDTFFEGVVELAPGTVLTIPLGGKPHEERYWKPTFEQNAEMTREEAIRTTREKLLRAVQIRLRADVPLAFCMSGGVDSNVLISIAKNVYNYDVHGFTIENTDARYEERPLIDHAIKAQSLRHTYVPVGAPTGLDDLRELVRYHDAPIYTISYFIHWFLMRAMKERGYRVSISGTAADELFSGYYDHHLAYLQVTEGTPDGESHARGWAEHVAPLVRNPFLSNPRYFVDDPRRREHVYLDAAAFSQMLQKPFAEPFAETSYTEDLLRNRMANELFTEAVPVILHEDDLNAMYWSIENRSPFLDRVLFEHTARIPTRHLMRDGCAKAVLREAVRGIVPAEIIENRRKVGFNAPIADVIDLRDPKVREELVAPSPIFEVVRRESVNELLASETLPNSRSKFLFNFVSAKFFLEEFGS
jgi:asparagine synthase (glutamine-hydrolysing)